MSISESQIKMAQQIDENDEKCLRLKPSAGKRKKEHRELKDSKEPLTEDCFLEGGIVFTCVSTAYGDGDLANFIDGANPKFLSKIQACKNQKISYVFVCPAASKKLVEHDLLANHMKNTHVIYYAENFSMKEIASQISSNKTLMKLLKSAGVVINIATSFMLEVMTALKIKTNITGNITATEDLGIPVLSIGEHGASGFFSENELDKTSIQHYNDLAFRHMGFALNHHGIFLKPPSEASSPAQCLSSISDVEFLSVLFDESIVKSISEEKATTFLEDYLIVPCYFHEGKHSCAAIMQAVIISKIASQYKHIVFSVNKGNFDIENFDLKALSEFNVSKIIHKNTQTKNVVTHSISNEAVITVTMIEGHYFTTNDFMAWIGAGQIFMGCAGDKTLEHALSYGKIPLFKGPNYKRNFVRHLLSVLQYLCPQHDFSFLDDISNKLDILIPHQSKAETFKIAQRISEGLNPELLKVWPEVCKQIIKRFNIYDVLPFMITQAIYLGKMVKLQAKAQHSKLNALSEEITKLESRIIARQSHEFKQLLEAFNLQPASVLLDLSNRFLSEAQLNHLFLTLSKHPNPSIKQLDLSTNHFHLNKVWPQVINFLSTHSLNSLNLSGCYIDPANFKLMVARLVQKSNKTLVSLKLNYCSLAKPHMGALAVLLQSCHFKEICLASNGIREEELKIVLEKLAKRNEASTIVDLSDNYFSSSASDLLLFSSLNKQYKIIVTERREINSPKKLPA